MVKPDNIPSHETNPMKPNRPLALLLAVSVVNNMTIQLAVSKVSALAPPQTLRGVPR